MAPVPATIGRYTVQRMLGRGGMGTVYLAVDPLIEREVAIKVLPLAGADDYSERLIAEARVSGRLIHPHIVGVFDVGEEQGQPFVVMPYVDGRTLASVLTDADRPAMPAKLRWMSQLCDALAYAHERRVIHRDVKPTNLLIDTQGHLRVLDFGIAKVLTTSQIQFTSVGTPAYMAPEQYSSDPVDPRTDVFSAGLVFYELLTHRRALTGTTPAQIYGQLMGAPMPRVLAAAPETNPSLAAVCERAMSRVPGDRFQTAREFGEAIEAARAGLLAITAPTLIGAGGSRAPEPPPVVAAPPVDPTPVFVAPPPVADPPPTIRLGRPNHDAILEREALAAPPEYPPDPEPEPAVEPDDRVAPRPAALVITAGVITALVALAALLWYLGSATPQIGVGSTGPRLHEHTGTPDLQHRQPAKWVRGYNAEGCRTPQVGAPVFYGEPQVAVYLAATTCGPDGTPDRSRQVLVAERQGETRVLWHAKGPDNLGASMMPSLDGTRMLLLEPDKWHVAPTFDAQAETTSPKGTPIDVSADGSFLVFSQASGRLGLFDIDKVQTTLLPATSDGNPPDAKVTFVGMSDNGRYLLFWSAATNLSGGSRAGNAPVLYRYDRLRETLHVVDQDLATARLGIHFGAAVSDDGDWITYKSMRRLASIVPDFVPDPSLYLYATQVSAGRTMLIDSAPVAASGLVGDVVPLGVLDANLLLYRRDLPGAETIDYLWQPLQIVKPANGQPFPQRLGCDRRALGNAAPPARMSPRCLRWIDGSSWCVARS